MSHSDTQAMLILPGHFEHERHFYPRLKIHVPETIWDTAKEEVPLWVQRMGGIAVVKVPYANAGQGVYTITNEGELQGGVHRFSHLFASPTRAVRSRMTDKCLCLK